MSKEQVKVERTGKQYSVASSEFLITFPDGSQETLWSPPWHELSEEDEEKEAIKRANILWRVKTSETLYSN